MKRTIAVFAVILMAVVACGGQNTTPTTSDEGASGGATTTTEASPSSTPSAPSTTEAEEESGESEDQLTTINFTLNWFPLGDHAAYYVAYDKEYYLDRGLLVNILQGSGSGESIRRVDIGQADIGISDTGVVINAIRNGADLKIIGMVWDEASLAIQARRDRGIEEFTDLNGKTIGAPAGDAGRIFFPELAEANGVDESTIQYVDLQAAAKYGALGNGSVDAIFDATTGRPLVEETVGADNLVTFKLADYGLDMYGHAIFTTNRMLEEKPEVVRAFLDASYLGWVDVFEDPDGALATLQVYQPHIDLDQYKQNLELVFDLMSTERYAEGGIGWIDPDKMAATVELINATSEAERDATPEEVFTMDFHPGHPLPEAYRP